ncbi:MAG: hypothetical protein EOM24_33370 [Chloroflexia bacterium]|nr:hypothetical protein [Chloroflexia bacterium]
MLLHPTLETLAQLRLDGMLKALQEQLEMPEIQTLSFEERLGLLLDRELSTRENRRLKTRLKQAKKNYKHRYPPGSRTRYKIKLSFKPFRLRRRYLGWLLQLLLRRQRGYRLIDHLLVLHLLALTYRLLQASRPKLIPKFARKRAMGLGTIFK